MTVSVVQAMFHTSMTSGVTGAEHTYKSIIVESDRTWISSEYVSATAGYTI